VVVVIAGVVNESPVPIEIPPVGVLNQFIVVAEVAVNVTVPGPHLEPFVKFGAVGTCVIIA
jgi:hypothetical protein